MIDFIEKARFSRALVVGGAGFIGSNIVDALINIGVEVCVIDNLRSGRESNVDKHMSSNEFSFYKMDITRADMSYIFHSFRPEVIFYLAAIPSVPFSVLNPYLTNNTNVSGLLRVLESIRSVSRYNAPKIIFSSSSSVYGGSESSSEPESEDFALNPKSPYALQKKIGEEYCSLFSNLYNIDTVSLRYFNVFGPRQYCDSPYASVISSFCNAIKNGTSPIIYGDGEQTRDFCYVDNVVHANLLAANYPGKFSGDAFNIGTGNSISINKLCAIMMTNQPEYVSKRDGDVKNSLADITKASDVIGYRPLVSLESGLDKTLNWYLENA
jgi:UDP-glucose 4-epimerase